MVCCAGKVGFQEAVVSQKEIGDVYNKLAPLYNLWGRLTESKARNRAIELAAISGNDSIVEVAVGTGLAFKEIVKRNLRGTNLGLDLSEGMLERASKLLAKTGLDNFTLRKGNAFHLDIPNNSVDILFNNYMFDLIAFPDMDIILEEFKRVLKKEGRLVLVNMTIGEKPGSQLYERIYAKNPKLMGGCRGVRLGEKLGHHGFTVLTREYFQQMLFPSEVILARKE